MAMTRAECSRAIYGKMKEIVEIYKQFNPDGDYITLAWINEEKDNYIHFWDTNQDIDFAATDEGEWRI